MVIYRDIDRPPISLILPHLFLGAETDVTQDCLSSQGITYVLSVSRCCPQPAFLPESQYLRIPINDSLRDELLPWIPEALQFIDGAMSLGCSVLVHCVAGVSRSPALAVAYVMYRLGLDLDNAYRFVKERRPSVSPNFNFLGQLQYFQGTLAQKGPGTRLNALHIQVPEAGLCSNEDNYNSPSLPLSTNWDRHFMKNSFVKDCTEKIKQCTQCDNYNYNNENFKHNNSEGAEISTTQITTNSPKEVKPNITELTLSLSDRLRALTLSLNHTEMQNSTEVLIQNQDLLKSVESKPFKTPTTLKMAPGTTTFSDRRKALTLSLLPVGVDPYVHQKRDLENNHTKGSHQYSQKNRDYSFNTGERRGVATSPNIRTPANKSSQNLSSVLCGNSQRNTTHQFCQKRQENGEGKHSCNSKSQNKGERKSCYCFTSQQSRESHDSNSSHEQNGENWSLPTSAKIQTKKGCNSKDEHQEAPDEHCASAVEAVEGIDLEQILLSPINLTVNRLLSWGERMLLGALLGPRIKVGQVALPYRC